MEQRAGLAASFMRKAKCASEVRPCGLSVFRLRPSKCIFMQRMQSFFLDFGFIESDSLGQIPRWSQNKSPSRITNK